MQPRRKPASSAVLPRPVARGTNIDYQGLSVGDWTILPDTNQITRDGEVSTLQPLSMDILVYLARHAGEVVTPQEILDRFWERRIVGDDAVHRRIADIRRHLGDDSRQPRYVRTIPKRGYQMIAAVEWPTSGQVSRKAGFSFRRTAFFSAIGASLAAIGTAVYVHDSAIRDRQMAAAIDAAERHVLVDDFQAAFDFLRDFRDDPDERVVALLERITMPADVVTEPAGVPVFYRYTQSSGDWSLLGTTPINNAALPRGNYKLRLGDSVLMNATHPGATLNSAGGETRVIAMPTAEIPPGMAFVPGGKYRFGAWGFDEERDLGPFLIDKTEVTNAEYFEFVQAGGYRDRQLWQTLVDDSQGILSWEIIERQFVDETGVPGPQEWSLGSYAPGEADLPVTGISWYEAAAYLAFHQKSLPTVQHWLRAALGPMEWKYPFAAVLVPESNLDSTGLHAVGTRPGAESGGVFDLIGNASEWTKSAVPGGYAVIGASFRDPAWSYNFPHPSDALRRSDELGFRGIRHTEHSNPDPQQIELFRDFTSSVRKISDEMFEGMRLNFEYREGSIDSDDALLVDERGFDQWTRQLVHLPGSHGDDPLPVYLYLPKTRLAAVQPVIFMPPADSWAPGFRSDSVRIESYQLDFVPRSGRALVWPVYFGSHERYDGYHAAPPSRRGDLALLRNRMIRDEIGRVVDFLDSSPQFDGERVGLIGLSHGAILASYSLATEKRIRAAVLYSVGVAMPNPVFDNPLNDPNVFWARVTQPTLIINGRYDPLRPQHFVLNPLVDLLGSPPEAKKGVLYESSHWPLQRYRLMRDTLDWLDRYLGPVDPLHLSH